MTDRPVVAGLGGTQPLPELRRYHRGPELPRSACRGARRCARCTPQDYEDPNAPTKASSTSPISAGNPDGTAGVMFEDAKKAVQGMTKELKEL